MKSIFEKILDREIPAKILLDDELCIAIEDIEPQAPIHILIIPKKKIVPSGRGYSFARKEALSSSARRISSSSVKQSQTGKL